MSNLSYLSIGMVKNIRRVKKIKMNKVVSVIVPVYNGEKYIEQTLSYILKSTYMNLEILVVNDGSTDMSLEICKRIQEQDKRVVLLTKENGGVASARNYGVENATGDYICFCDQDDIVDKEAYFRMVTAIEKYQADICMCSTNRYISGKYTSFEISDDAYYTGDEILEELLYPLLFKGYDVPVKMSTKNRYAHIWNCMFRAEFWKKYNFKFRIYVNHEDDLLVKIEALTKALGVVTLSHVGYYWRVNLKSETYAHKYVENIAYKQQQCYNDMERSLTERIRSKEILLLFKQVTICMQYLEAVHNLTSPYKKKSISNIRKYFNECIYSRCFEESIQARHYLKKGRVKPKILLPIIAKKMSVISYLSEIFLDKMLLISLRSPVLSKLERRIKDVKIR